MDFEKPLLDGVLLKRYKRFLADVRLKNSAEEILAHVPNSGSMLGVRDPGSLCRVSFSDNPKRKIPYTLEMVRASSGAWVGVNTSLPNKLVLEAFISKLIPGWKKYDAHQKEVFVSEKSRLDLLLSNKKTKHYVEIKNVSMARPPHAVFPDAVTARGLKHLEELLKLQKAGHLAEIFFVVQREDCDSFSPAEDIDPAYAACLKKVVSQGVLIQAWACEVGPKKVCLQRPLDIKF